MPDGRDHAFRPASRLSRIVLGRDAPQRLALLRTLIALGVYVLCLAIQWAAVPFGFTTAFEATLLTIFCLTGAGGFVVAMRIGLTKNVDVSTLTMAQMIFAIVSSALAYHFNPHLRGTLPIIVALVLVFGAFTLSAKQCRQLGQFGVIVFAVTMAYGAWRDPAVFDPVIEAFYFSNFAMVLVTIAVLAGQLSQLRTNERVQRRALRDAMEQLKLLATHDELTKLPNRRHVQEWMPHEMARVRRSDASLCIAIIDLDRFKRINDTFGHAAGDEVLRIFAREAKAMLREGDVLARWGGEEFLLVMPSTRLPEALAAIERIRARVALPASWVDCPHSRVTFSAGTTQVRSTQSLEDALQWADFGLYEAKAQGRDRSVIAESGGMGADRPVDYSLSA